MTPLTPEEIIREWRTTIDALHRHCVPGDGCTMEEEAAALRYIDQLCARITALEALTSDEGLLQLNLKLMNRQVPALAILREHFGRRG